MRAAHQVVLERVSPRPSPPNNFALHSCDNRACVNVRHLRWGSHDDNMQDLAVRGGKAGTNNPRAKATWDVVRQIRELYAQGGVTYRQLGSKFGLAKPTVGEIVRGDKWKAEDDRLEEVRRD